MKKLRTLGILFLVFAMILSFAACGGNETDQTPAPENSGNNEASNSPASSENSTGKRGTLNLGEYGENSYVSCFDGQSIWSMGGGMGMKNLIYDCPFYFDSKGDYQTRIFESTKWTDDTHLVCKMRDNIYFSNGDQMLGDDVLYSLELCQGTILLADWYMAVDLSQTTLSDDMLTITFCFTGPYAAYHRSLSFCILDKDYLESVGGGENIDWFDPAQVVGSGPYACTEFIPDGSSTYVLREDWWGFQYGFDVPFNRINATQYSDQTTMAIDLENGVINLALDITVQDYDRLAADSGDDLEVTTIRNNSVTSVYFNINNSSIMSNPKVREALCYAIDTDAVARAVGGEIAIHADGLFAEQELGFVPSGYEYDPERAKSALAESGLSADELSINMVAFSYEPHTSISEILQGYWSEIGLSVSISYSEIGAFIAQFNNPDFTDAEIYIMGANPEKDPSTHLSDIYVTSNHHCFRRGQEYTDLMEAAIWTLDESVRAENYGKLQKLFHDNYDGIGLYEGCIAVGYNAKELGNVDLETRNYPFDITVK